MDLKQELEGLKLDLTANFETKSKLDIQNAIDAFEVKAKAQEAKSKESFDSEIKALKDDFQAKSKLQQDHLDALDIRLKQSKGDQKLETKTFNQILGEAIKENAEAIQAHKQGDNLKIELKAVGDMSIAANFPGSTPWTQDVRKPLMGLFLLDKDIDF